MDEWQPSQGETTEPHLRRQRTGQRNLPRWIATIVAVAAVGGVLWYVLRELPGAATGAEDAGPDAGGSVPDGGAVWSLAEGEALLRRLAAAWSNSPQLARWLAVDDILRRLTAAVNLVAEGDSPRSVLTFLSVGDDFDVIDEGAPKAKKVPKAKRKKRRPTWSPSGRLFVDPESYARYDGLTEAFTSVDASAAGAAYAQLRPYFESAFAQIGRPDRRFDEALAAALQRLASVRLLEGQVELVPKGAVYAFKDPALESLTAAEKHLLRFGPKNGKAIQDSLRRFSESADLPRKP